MNDDAVYDKEEYCAGKSEVSYQSSKDRIYISPEKISKRQELTIYSLNFFPGTAK